ncbi:integrase/recombinase XerC [Granulicella rosea]|uniref:Integrase/recombinase XerC n=1 Tax=Granulicella rosea TaxID=474952 RepID=A0A239KM00_9BACT|nr:integrase/recombinase XerC [Granulicella rosea]
MQHARPHMRCWLLLCSDLAIRSGTAIALTPSCYDKDAGVLRFRSKYESTVALPVTAELAALLNKCDDPCRPFIAQLSGRRSTYGSLSVQFRKLRKLAGVTRQITPHDLRRTTARNVYQITKDLRIVQALLGHADLAHTAWYLQDDMTPVLSSTLELAKLNPTTEVIQ